MVGNGDLRSTIVVNRRCEINLAYICSSGRVRKLPNHGVCFFLFTDSLKFNSTAQCKRKLSFLPIIVYHYCRFQSSS